MGGSSCKKDFRSICGNIQYFAKWRKFQKIQENLSTTKTHCVLSSLQLGLNLSNSTVVTFYFAFVCIFTSKKQRNIFLCFLFLKDKQANPSISSEILVMISSGRFRILNGNERIFFEKGDRISFRDFF